MRSRTTAITAGLFAAALALAGCSNDASSSGGGGQGGGASAPPAAAADCPLASAGDPVTRLRRPTSRCPAPRRSSKPKPTYRVAFSQNASNNPWRLAETASMQDEAKQARPPAHRDRRQQRPGQADPGHQGPDRAEARPDVHRADHRATRATSWPRRPAPASRSSCSTATSTTAAAKPGEDFVTVIVSDFIQQGKRAAWAMATGDRRQRQDHRAGGHHRRVAGHRPQEGLRRDDRRNAPGMQVVVSQSGDFTRAKGQAGGRDAAAVPPGRHRDLRPQRRDGAGRDRGDPGRRQGAGQGHHGGLDRRRRATP